MNSEIRYRLWADIQKEGSNFFSKRRQLFLLSFLRKGQKVLNIGVGDLTFEKLAILKGIDVYSIDPDKESIDYLIDRLHMQQKAKVGLAEQIPFDNDTFEAVVASEVLEHLNDTELISAIKEIHRVLKPDGFLIGTVPADECFDEETVLCPYCGRKFHRWGHLQSFNEKQLYTLLASQFSRITLKRVYIEDTQKLNWKGKLHFILKSILLRLGYKGKGEKFFFRAYKY